MLGDLPSGLHTGKEDEITKVEVLAIVLVPILPGDSGIDTVHDIPSCRVGNGIETRRMGSAGIGGTGHARDSALLIGTPNPETVGLVNGHTGLGGIGGSGEYRSSSLFYALNGFLGH